MTSHSSRDIPDWQLPPGVTRSLWQYTQTPAIATEYDEYFAYNKLFEYDQALLAEYFRRPGRVVDLGCGTGRILIPLAQRGFQCLGVDLSQHMLRMVQEKARNAGVQVDCMRANMVELEAIRDQSADYVVSMFSTLAMIQGHEHRRRALAHARRILMRGGLFACHVHNRWYNLRDPQGRRWLLRHFFESRFQRDVEAGDKVFFYRGIPHMYMHIYSQHEFKSALGEVGFKVVRMIPLDTERFQPLAQAWLLGNLRANGWIAICK